jgi:hypothetical protein
MADDAAEMAPVDVCADLVEWPLYIAAQPADLVVSALRRDPELARSFISGEPDKPFTIEVERPATEQADGQRVVSEVELFGLGIDASAEELTALLRRLQAIRRTGDYPRESVAVPEPLQGLAGLSTTLVLQRLLPLDDDPLEKRILMGRIRDYTFDEVARRGHLAVDTCTDIADADPADGDQREYYHWDIDIAAGGFIVEKRVEPTVLADNQLSYPADPFPGISLAFPDFSLDPDDPRSIWHRGLDHKLHARAKAVTITDIYYRKLAGTADEVRLRRLENDPLYETSDATCVDLLTKGPPPGTFAELVEPTTDYCLGRCAMPPIVNSGD